MSPVAGHRGLDLCRLHLAPAGGIRGRHEYFATVRPTTRRCTAPVDSAQRRLRYGPQRQLPDEDVQRGRTTGSTWASSARRPRHPPEVTLVDPGQRRLRRRAGGRERDLQRADGRAPPSTPTRRAARPSGGDPVGSRRRLRRRHADRDPDPAVPTGALGTTYTATVHGGLLGPAVEGRARATAWPPTGPGRSRRQRSHARARCA